jgi:uncharacterized protein
MPVYVSPAFSDAGVFATGGVVSGYFELKVAAGDHFMWNLKAGNHEIILTSQLYKQREGALQGIESVRKNAAHDERYERKESKDGQHYFVLTALNGQVIGKSEMYQSESGRDNGIKSVKTNALRALLKEIH